MSLEAQQANKVCSPLKRCWFDPNTKDNLRFMAEIVRCTILYVTRKIQSFILWGCGEISICPRTWFLGGRERWVKVIGWVKSQKLHLTSLVLRYLKWWMYFVGNCLIAVTATSFGFALGVVLIILLYDDGLERVTDLYNYCKNLPKR